MLLLRLLLLVAALVQPSVTLRTTHSVVGGLDHRLEHTEYTSAAAEPLTRTFYREMLC